MGDFERRVLRLVSEGKISAEEGEELLHAHERAPLRDIRAIVEGSLSGMHRVVRDATEERVEELLRAEIQGAEEPIELKVSGDFALAVQAGEPGACRVVWRVARSFFGDAPEAPRVALDGRTLRVESPPRGGGFSMGLPLVGLALDVYLPPGTTVGGTVMQRVGRIAFADLPIGSLRLDAQNGRVRIETPRLEEISVVSRNGSITVAAGLGQKLRVDAWNGRVDVRGGIREVEVTTRNGRIEADLANVEKGRCRLRTLNGPVELRLPAGTSAEIRAETVHGAIFVDVPGLILAEDVRELTRRRLRGRLSGTDGDIAADLETTNGAVRIGQMTR